MKIIIKWFILAISIIFCAYLIKGISIAGFWSALWAAAFLSLINIIIRPVLIILTLPINILTLGLFTLVINALLILFASAIIKGFEADGFWPALIFSIVLSIVSYILNKFVGTK